MMLGKKGLLLALPLQRYDIRKSRISERPSEAKAVDKLRLIEKLHKKAFHRGYFQLLAALFLMLVGVLVVHAPVLLDLECARLDFCLSRI